MTSLEWINGGWKTSPYCKTINGQQGIDVDGIYGFQCVDFSVGYSIFMGAGFNGGHTSNAIDLWNRPQPGWKKVTSPQPGDVFVRNAVFGGVNYGDTGVVQSVTSTGTNNIQQNMKADLNNGSPPSSSFWGFNQVLGYLRREGTDMSNTDLGLARIRAYHIAGRDGYDGRPNALAGETDKDLQSHIGTESNADEYGWYTSQEGKVYREQTLPKVFADRDTYKKNLDQVTSDRDGLIVKLDTANKQIADLQKQLADTPAADPDTVSVSKTSLWVWFKNLPFINKKG